jgi:hypothetical protein
MVLIARRRPTEVGEVSHALQSAAFAQGKLLFTGRERLVTDISTRLDQRRNQRSYVWLLHDRHGLLD